MTTTTDLDALRTALSAAAERETAAVRAYKAAAEELTAAQRGYRAVRKAFDAAAYAREFERTHPPLFGERDQGASETTTGRHEPDPGPEQGAYDVCLHCGRAIREAPELGAWVTTTSRNPECYGRRN